MSDIKQVFDFVRNQRQKEWRLIDLYKLIKRRYKTIDYATLQALIDNGVIRHKVKAAKQQAADNMFNKFIIS